MEMRLAAQLAALNQHKIIDYMNAQGLEPVAVRRHESIYEIAVDDETVTLIVDHAENRFIDEDHQRKGSLTNLVCLLYICTPSDLCSDPRMYGFETLLPED